MKRIKISFNTINDNYKVISSKEIDKINQRIKKMNKHGGARKGAGRKPKEPTVTIRVKVSKLEEIKKINNS